MDVHGRGVEVIFGWPWTRGGGGVSKIDIFCGRHICMVPKSVFVFCIAKFLFAKLVGPSEGLEQHRKITNTILTCRKWYVLHATSPSNHSPVAKDDTA